MPLALNRGMPWPVSLNVRPVWVPAGIVSRTRPLRVWTGTSPPKSASSSVSGSSRSRSSPLRLNRLSGWTRTTTTRSPPPGARPVSLMRRPVSTPAGMVISSRFPSTSTRRVVPRYASSSVISACASCVAAGAGRAARRPPVEPPVEPPAFPPRPMPARMSSKPGPPPDAVRPDVRVEPPAPVISSPKNIRKKSLNSPVSAVEWNS